MAALLATVVLLCGVLLAGRGFWVWTHCGYDCAAIPLLGWSATFAGVIGAVLLVCGMGMLLSALLARGK